MNTLERPGSFESFVEDNPGLTAAQYSEQLAAYRDTLARIIDVSIDELHYEMTPEEIEARLEAAVSEADNSLISSW